MTTPTRRGPDGPRPPAGAAARRPLKQRLPLLLAGLDRLYPDPRCELDFRTPLELLVATILSAQCTDARVNRVTPALFAAFPTAAAYAAAPPGAVEALIHSTGFYRNKAKHIRDCCRLLVARHGGQVPASLAALAALPGVGRKTANVVLGNAFGVPGVTVDTHVGRLSRRLGLTRHTDPVKAELALMRHLPRAGWTRICLQLIAHGRRVCSARSPACHGCGLAPLCPRNGVALKDGKPTAADPGPDE